MLNPDLDLFEKIKIASVSGFQGIEPWINEFEFVCKKDLVKCLNDYGVEVPTSIAIKGYFENDGDLMGVEDNHLVIFNECLRRIELSVEIGAKFIVAIPALSNRNHFTTYQQSISYYEKLLELGERIGCNPTLEFIGTTKQIYNFELCEKFLDNFVSKPTMVIDAYHIWRGNGHMDDFLNFDARRVSCFHISDADKMIDREIHRDRDRVMPLDGKIDLHKFAENVKKIGYTGFISAGVYNPNLWNMDQYEMARKCRESLKNLFEN